MAEKKIGARIVLEGEPDEERDEARRGADAGKREEP